MMSILRDDQARICIFDRVRCISTTTSQGSALTLNQNIPLDICYFLTGTLNPEQSLFKPFAFTANVQLAPPSPP